MLISPRMTLPLVLVVACGEGSNDSGTPVSNPAPECLAAMENAKLRPNAPSYEEWRAKKTRIEPGERVLLFEDDMIIRSEAHLHATYLNLFAEPTDSATFRSIAYCYGDGFDGTWSASQKLNLTWCMGSFNDPVFGDLVREQFRKSTEIWERAADVNFVPVPEMDPAQCDCISPADALDKPACGGIFTNRAAIRVRQSLCTEGCRPAFADGPRASPLEVAIHFTANDTEGQLARIVTHEIGHTLGFAHEHLQFDQIFDDCMDDDPWRVVTDPDRDSIMGYGTCKGTNKVFDVSPLDRVGLAYLYNIPRNEFPSFTNSMVDDIMWYLPEEAQESLLLWRFEARPTGEPLAFTVDGPYCYGHDGSECLNGQNRLKPIPVSISTPTLTDVLFYGPGTTPDSLRTPSMAGPPGEIPAVINRKVDKPIPGQFFLDDESEEVIWAQPGSQTDAIGVLGQGGYTVPNGDFIPWGASDLYYYPFVGLWDLTLGLAAPNSQILWFREKSRSILLTYQADDGVGHLQEIVSPACFLSLSKQLTPLRGDFDGDDQSEIFWVSHLEGLHVFWRDTTTMWSGTQNVCSNPNVAQIVPTNNQIDLAVVKPFVGDFDGDDSDDIFWYAPGPGPDFLWTDVGNIAPNKIGLVISGDYSPVVGDFNGDLCDDILWFAPNTEWSEFAGAPTGGPDEIEHIEGSSFIWRSNCDGSFVSQDVVLPDRAYPIGYYPRNAGRRADR